MKTKPFLLLLLSLYLISALGVFGFKSVQGSSPTTSSGSSDLATDDSGETALGKLLVINPQEPKDQPCPLNGKLFTATEKNAWEKRRPLAVMIENSQDARPQSGLSKADVVYEAVAEGGITRFMAMYLCAAQIDDVTIAPVRSARTYFVDWASGYNRPLYVHVGGANVPGPVDALGQIGQYGWNQQNDLNQFSIGYPTFVRNENRLNREVATEHTMETTSEKLWAIGTKRGWTNLNPERKVGKQVIPAQDWKANFKGWNYSDEAVNPGTVNAIDYEFWSGYSDFAVKWTYDPATNTYKRTLGGEPHTDLNTGEQLAFSNVIILQTDEKGPVDELKHMLYRTTGTGTGLLFNNGTVTKIKWSKPDRESELQFTDTSGKPVKLVRGPIWISVLDTSTPVNYTPS